MKNKTYQTGFTLIEIMIALLIGVFLLAGVINIFLSSKQTYRMQEGLSRLQENGRFAMEFLSKDIRMAGFIGCNSDSSLITTTCTAAGVPAGCKMPNTLQFTPAGYLYDFATAIQGFESTSSTAWTPAINAAITTPLGGSDVITIRRADDQSFTVIAPHAAGTDVLTLDATATTANLQSAGFLKSDGTNNCTIAVVSNCTAAAVFQVSAVTGSVLSHGTGGSCAPQNITGDLGNTFVGGQVHPINTISYYVRTGSAGQPSLYRRVGANAADAEELVEGIEQMQILYGEDLEIASPPTTPGYGVPNYYVTANNVVNMARVVSIRITLTARTMDANLTTTGDGRIRRTFTSTIAVRNRLR